MFTPQNADNLTMVLAITWAFLTLLSGGMAYLLLGILRHTERKEAPKPLSHEKVIIRSDIRTITVVILTFTGFNAPVLFLFIVGSFWESKFIEYCAGIAFSTFVLMISLMSYWKKRYAKERNVVEYLLK